MLIIFVNLSLAAYLFKKKKVILSLALLPIIILFHLVIQVMLFSSIFLLLDFILPMLLYLLAYLVLSINFTILAKIRLLESTLELKQAKIDFYANQLHTHHIFNEFSRIGVFILQSPQKAREYLIEFADILRYSLKFGDQKLVPVLEQVHFLKTYLRQQKLIYGELFQYQPNVDEEELADIQIPWGVFTPLVENAVKYGELWMKENSEELSLSVSLKIQKKRLSFEVVNPFIENKEPMNQSEKGLLNVRKRCEMILGSELFDLDLASADGVWRSKLTITLN